MNGRPSSVSLEAQTTSEMPAARAAAKTLYVLGTLLAKMTGFGAAPGPGDRGQVHHRVHPRVAVVDRGERRHHLPVVGELHPGVRAELLGGRHPVKVHHLVRMLDQLADHRPA